ncbi:MAG: pentapeptide repeat-containing protein, partial [Halobacteria archaeon]
MGSCGFEFDPQVWNDSNQKESSLDETWICPHDSYMDSGYCIFHMSVDERSELGVTRYQIQDGFTEAISKDGVKPGFVGCSFENINFEGVDLGEGDATIDLRHTEFDKLRLKDVDMAPDLYISNSRLGKVCIDGSRFGNVSWEKSYFNNDFSADSTEFRGDVDISESEFRYDCIFPEANFRGSADFGFTEFKGENTNFRNVEFRDRSDFRSSEFQDVVFSGSDFSEIAVFSTTRFRGEAEFEFLSFGGGCVFDESVFDHDTRFRGSDFQGESSFREVEFRSWVSFRDCRPGAQLIFDDTKFRKNLIFVPETAREKNMVSFQGCLVLDGEIFLPLNILLDLSYATLGNVSLNTEVSGQNPFDHLFLVKTKFRNFDFEAYENELKELDYRIYPRTEEVTYKEFNRDLGDVDVDEMEATLEYAVDDIEDPGLERRFKESTARIKSTEEEGFIS